jgi:hypothetical protein
MQPVASLDAVAVPALAADPSDAKRVYASTGQSGVEDGLYLSTDQGSSFAAYGARAKDRVYDDLLISAQDSSWLQISGLRLAPDMASLIFFFGYSSDRGLTFTHYDFTLASTESGLRLLGLHPKTSGTVFGLVQADETTDSHDRVLLSADFGKTWKDLLTAHRVEAFVSDDTGTKLWVGARDGLWRSSDAGKTWQHPQAEPVHCLLRRGSRLYACDEHHTLAGVSFSDDNGDSMQALMHFTDVTQMVGCPVTSSVAIACSGPWADWQRELAIGFGLDGGVANKDAGSLTGARDASTQTDAQATNPDAGLPLPRGKQATGCSCRVGSQGSGHVGGAGMLLLILGLWRAPGRRAARRRGH